MRKTDDIINLILDIYHGHEWYDMEEFFVAAQAILSYHGARFKMLDDIKDDTLNQLRDSFYDQKGYISNWGHQRKKNQEEFFNVVDGSPDYQQLLKYDDSEEGFQEELNSVPIDNNTNIYQISAMIFHKFITFKD